MPGTVFENQIILISASVLVSLLFFVLWLTARNARYNLYWALAFSSLTVVLLTAPANPPEALTATGIVSIIAALMSVPMLVQGALCYRGKPLAHRTLLLGSAVLLLGFIAAFLVRAPQYYLAACTGMAFVFTGYNLRRIGLVENIAAALFIVRGGLLFVSVAAQGTLVLSVVSITQVLSLATGLVLLFVSFLASRRELESVNALLSTSHQVSERLSALADVETVARQALEVLVGDSADRAVCVYQHDADRNTLKLLATAGWMSDGTQSEGVRTPDELPIDESVAGLALRTRKFQIIDDHFNDSRVAEIASSLFSANRELFKGTTLHVPLTHGDSAYGIYFICFRDPHYFSRQELEAYCAIGRSIGLRMANALQMEALSYQAHHDSLTELPNRVALHAAFAGSRGESSSISAAMYLIDLDHFKEINDTLGHRTGDLILRQVAARLQALPTDTSKLCARLGGDEFALIVFGVSGPAVARAIAAKIIESISQPFSVGDMSLCIAASVGISISPDDGVDSHELLRCADVAMYQAKQSVSSYAAYTPEHDPHTRERLALMSDLNSPTVFEQMELHYQPKLRLDGRSLAGVEGLIRWQHPALGPISPDQFIPMCEVGSVINQISLWVLDEAIGQVMEWRDQGRVIPVAINISARNLIDDKWYLEAIERIERSGVDATLLEMEVTESVMMREPEEASRKLSALSEIGVRISIDDFGTGYSSLNYLRKLPIQALKIDRSFVSDLDRESDWRIIDSVLSLAGTLGMEVIAEGIEQQEQELKLRELGCTFGQGFYIAPPLPIRELDEWLSQHRADIPMRPVGEHH